MDNNELGPKDGDRFDTFSFRAGLGAGKELGFRNGFFTGVFVALLLFWWAKKAAN